ncbi:DUF4124 domain-containing protein [Marinobacteraceae bacterium S3BR75-40.1]
MHLSRIGIFLFALLVASSSAWATQMYRYKTENGRTALSNTLPPGAAERGYEILNASGRVIETVPPAPTEEEIAEQKRQEAERKRAEEEAKRRQEADRQLLRTYSHPDDAARALNRKLEEMRSIIQLKQGNIAIAQSQIRQEQSRAANMERSGNEVPQTLLDKIERLKAKIREVQSEITSYQKELDDTIAEFRHKIERLEELTDSPRTVPLKVDGEATQESSSGTVSAD